MLACKSGYRASNLLACWICLLYITGSDQNLQVPCTNPCQNSRIALEVHTMFHVQVQILDLLPRPNPQNESFGATTAYSIGWWNRTGYTTPGYAPSRAATVIYKVCFSWQ